MLCRRFHKAGSSAYCQSSRYLLIKRGLPAKQLAGTSSAACCHCGESITLSSVMGLKLWAAVLLPAQGLTQFLKQHVSSDFELPKKQTEEEDAADAEEAAARDAEEQGAEGALPTVPRLCQANIRTCAQDLLPALVSTVAQRVKRCITMNNCFSVSWLGAVAATDKQAQPYFCADSCSLLAANTRAPERDPHAHSL